MSGASRANRCPHPASRYPATLGDRLNTCECAVKFLQWRQETWWIGYDRGGEFSEWHSERPESTHPAIREEREQAWYQSPEPVIGI